MKPPKDKYSLEQIDDIVYLYQHGGQKERDDSLTLLIDIFEFYFLKYIKLTKSGPTKDYDNREAKEFLRLFVSKKDKTRKSFAEVKRNIAATLESYGTEDLYNEYIALFITLLDRYEKRPGINFMRFVTKYFRFYVRNWLVRISRDPLFHLVQPSEESLKIASTEDSLPATSTGYFEEKSRCVGDTFKNANMHAEDLSLSWVLHCPKWIFAHLTHYQRYLLFLYFAKGEGCVNIAVRLNKSKDTVTSHMQKIFKKIKRLEARKG